MIHETLENIENEIRRHTGRITGVDFQTSLEVLKKEIEKEIAITEVEKPTFDLFFEKLAFKENGKGKHPALAFLIATVKIRKLNSTMLQRMTEYCKILTTEVTQRQWNNQELILNPLQKITSACRDAQSFLNPKIAPSYQYEIKASALNEEEKQILLTAIKEISEK